MKRMIMVGLSFVTCMFTHIHADVLTSVADTFVENNNPDTSYGSSTFIRTGNDGGSFNFPKGDDTWAILRFDLSTVSGTITSANLGLQQTLRFADYDIYGVADGGTDENFNEASYTFNNSAYSISVNGVGNDDGSLNKDHVDLTLLGSFSTTAAPEAVNFSSANLLSFLNADTNNRATFILYQSTQDKSDHEFSSREALSGQPTLTVIPEPSSVVLLIGGLAFVVLGMRRRK